MENHRLLARQMRKHLGAGGAPDTAEFATFTAAVNEAYLSFDSDKEMLERSLKLSSTELLEINQQIAAQKKELEASLTRIKEMQEQMVLQQKMASLGTLIAGIAHEIKNPLNFINNFAKLTAELSEELKELAKTGYEENKEDIEDTLTLICENAVRIAEHGERADSIVKGMLLHSRGEAGSKQTIDIHELLDKYAALAYHGKRAEDQDFNVSIERDYDRTVPALYVIEQDISRVFLNLLTNAYYAVAEKAKASDGDFKPTVEVSTHRRDDAVEISIKDNGIGIPKELQAKTFDPFFTTKPPGAGTGLGLSITVDLVREHQGTISLDSTEGVGTNFTISLPIDSSTGV